MAKAELRNVKSRNGRTAAEWEEYLNLLSKPGRFEAAKAETSQFSTLFGPDHAVPSQFGDLPLCVVTAGSNDPQNSENQKDLARMSTKASHITISETDHMSILLNKNHAALASKAILDIKDRLDI